MFFSKDFLEVTAQLIFQICQLVDRYHTDFQKFVANLVVILLFIYLPFLVNMSFTYLVMSMIWIINVKDYASDFLLQERI